MKLLYTLILLFAFFNGCSTEPEVVKQNGISGTVLDNAGNPIPNAAILLTYTYGSSSGSEGRNRPSTTINYDLVSEFLVQIWIEEICGDTVIVLVDEIQPSGSNQITWNAADSNGNQVVDGAYIVTMLAGSYQAEQLLIRMTDDYFHLDTIEGQNYHAMTDENGFFNLPLECLSFGYADDREINELGLMTIQNKVKIWVIHPDHEPYSTDFIDVDLTLGVNKTIVIP